MTTGSGRRAAGELESSILGVLGAAEGPLTPGEVRAALGDTLARTTVVTILTRLLDKGVVTRTPAGRAFAYAPVADLPSMAADRMHAELDREPDRRTVLARFVSRLDRAEERQLRELLDLAAADPPVESEPGASRHRTEGGST
ncbi:BlaI/MecI/CopY family transcriptional regulator [Embleya sp. NPDC055664]|uniref:BlaI/MecI/CopY family transcriptional regulator n=1 Tax=Embleya sp. NPDC059237 TaxID=3346784 RepID=UPI003686E3D2